MENDEIFFVRSKIPVVLLKRQQIQDIKIEQQTAKIDYIAMMADINVETDEEVADDEQ